MSLSSSLRARARRAARSARWYPFHRMHWRKAREALAAIEAIRGPLASETRAACDAWAREVLGWRGYAPWLYSYAAFADEFREGWIPDNYFGRVVVPTVDEPHGSVSHLKTLSHKVLGADALPDLLYRVKGRFLEAEGEGYRFLAPSDVRDVLFAEGTRAVFKPDESLQGRGIVVLDADDFDPGALAGLGDGVFQRYVEQAEVLHAMAPGSVATLRLTTVVEKDGTIGLRAAYLRVGREDDAHVRSASNVRLPVDRATGAFAETGFLPSWREVDRHPDSGVVFAGQSVPSYGACVETVKALHRRVPQVASVGWDVTVDRCGAVVLLEWNGTHNDVKFSETIDGPCFTGLGWEDLWRSP